MFVADGGLADTIVACSSPRGPAARAIVRVSGPRAADVLEGIFFPALAGARGGVRIEGELRLDDARAAAAALVFRAPRSYTGEDLVEVHTVGAPPLVERLCGAIAGAGARAARPGEFTRRAFLAGRIDLTAAEAVLALDGAAGEDEARAALRQLRGGLRREVEALRERLLDALAELEAAIDFAHEDLEHDLLAGADLRARLADARRGVARILAREAGRGAAHARPAVLLYGPENAGKSSLLNALARAELAIVSPRPGTTRDAVAAEIEAAPGIAVDLIDAAGTGGAAAQGPGLEAQRRSEQALLAAEIVLVVLDASKPASDAALAALEKSRGRPRVVVLQKSDLPRALALDRLEEPAIAVSARTGAGLEPLRAALAALLAARPAPAAEVAPNERHRAALAAAARALDAALAILATAGPADIAAIDLRAALDALAEVTGEARADDVLDRIFAKFCIGK
jgi:tRNA modification GTPase